MALPPYGSLTSPQGPAVSTIGLQIQISANTSPANYFTVLNATDFKLPTKAETVDVTNFGDLWRRRIPTLLDMGDISFKVFWEMEEATHHAGVDGNCYGLRYLMLNRLLVQVQVIYPDGNNSTDEFPAYVTNFSVSGAQGKVFEAEITLSNSGQPSLV